MRNNETRRQLAKRLISNAAKQVTLENELAERLGRTWKELSLDEQECIRKEAKSIREGVDKY